MGCALHDVGILPHSPVEGCSGRLSPPTELPPTDDVAYLLASAATLGLINSPAGVEDVLLPKLALLCCCCCRSCVWGATPLAPPRLCSALRGALSLSRSCEVSARQRPDRAAVAVIAAVVGLPGWLRPSLLGTWLAAALLLSIKMLPLLTCRIHQVKGGQSVLLALPTAAGDMQDSSSTHSSAVARSA